MCRLPEHVVDVGEEGGNKDVPNQDAKEKTESEAAPEFASLNHFLDRTLLGVVGSGFGADVHPEVLALPNNFNRGPAGVLQPVHVSESPLAPWDDDHFVMVDFELGENAKIVEDSGDDIPNSPDVGEGCPDVIREGPGGHLGAVLAQFPHKGFEN